MEPTVRKHLSCLEDCHKLKVHNVYMLSLEVLCIFYVCTYCSAYDVLMISLLYLNIG